MLLELHTKGKSFYSCVLFDGENILYVTSFIYEIYSFIFI